MYTFCWLTCCWRWRRTAWWVWWTNRIQHAADTLSHLFCSWSTGRESVSTGVTHLKFKKKIQSNESQQQQLTVFALSCIFSSHRVKWGVFYLVVAARQSTRPHLEDTSGRTPHKDRAALTEPGGPAGSDVITHRRRPCRSEWALNQDPSPTHRTHTNIWWLLSTKKHLNIKPIQTWQEGTLEIST